MKEIGEKRRAWVTSSTVSRAHVTTAISEGIGHTGAEVLLLLKLAFNVSRSSRPGERLELTKKRDSACRSGEGKEQL